MRLTGESGILDADWQAAIPWLARSSIVLGLLAANVAIGIAAAAGTPDTIPVLILISAVACLSFLLLYRLGRFEYGILLVPLTAGLLNFATLPTGTQSRIVTSLIVVFGLSGAWALQWAGTGQQPRL